MSGKSQIVASVVIACVVAGVCFAAEEPKPGSEDKPKSFLNNGSYETQKKGKAVYWHLHLWPKRKDVEQYIYVSQEQAKEGKWSLKIDAKPPLKPKTSLCFNGNVSKDVLKTQGKPLAFSGWVYTPKDGGDMTISLRVRQWGKNEKGKNAFFGDAIALTVKGKPGEWMKFEKVGVIDPKKKVLSLDLHCNAKTSKEKGVRYVDDVRLTLHTPKKPADRGSTAK